MKRMMELAKLNENHKLLADLVGTWSYTVKMWMNPDASAPPSESKGTAVRKPIMNGRYFTMDVSGKMQMPGPDGKIKDMDFKGTSIEGYDNVKQKFVSTWADNMSTGIMMSEGTYDPAEKTFTYNAEMEMIPGMKQKVREVFKIADKDHHTFEWYEDRSGKQAKTMEINYTRKSSRAHAGASRQLCLLADYRLCTAASVAISPISAIVSDVQTVWHLFLTARAGQHHRRVGGCAFVQSLLRIQTVVRYYPAQSPGAKRGQWWRRDVAFARLRKASGPRQPGRGQQNGHWHYQKI